MIDETHGELTSAGDPAGWRAHLEEHGYLLLRGLLPRDAVTRTRADILDWCGAGGWLRDCGGAAVNPQAACEPPDPRYCAVYNKVVSLESFNTLAHQRPLLAAAEALLDSADVLPRPAKLARLIFPQDGPGATPPHQDFPHEQGTVEAYTAWVPLGDCPRDLGGLAVWPGSHRSGVLPHGFVPGVGGLGIETAPLGPIWLTTDFEAGDVLFFHSLTVHGALSNRTGRLRISADYRYQRIGDPMAPHMLRPSGGQLDWPEVYQAWTSTEHQYYWRDREVPLVEYDRSYYERRDREAFERARQGDPEARRFLLTISRRNPDPEVRRRAAGTLAELAAGAQAGEES